MLPFLRLTARRLLRHGSFSLINILGLSIGIAACLVIYLYVHDELTYDAHNTKIDRIARITSTFHSPESTTGLAITPMPLATAIVRDFPEIEAAVRIQQLDRIIRQGTQLFKEENLCNSEQAVFSIFSFTFLEGSADNALTAPGSIVLSRKLEKKYFGEEKALGKTIIIDGKSWKVTAVIADLPANSDLPIPALLYKDFSESSDWMGDDFSVFTYVLFRGQPNWKHFTDRLPQLSKYAQPQLDDQGARGYKLSFQAGHLKDVHFSTGELGDNPKGNRQFNTIFSVLALFILIVALLNFINLSTTKAIERAKEVGVRKVIGARPIQLVRQFLAESFLVIFIALGIAVALTEAGIPFINHTLDTHIYFQGWTTLLFLAILLPLVTLGGGLYPAFVLSAYQPIKVLKGKTQTNGKGIILRKTLTVVQFVIALTMLTGTAIIFSQMQYIAHKNMGVDRAGTISIDLPVEDTLLKKQCRSFCEALKGESSIQRLSIGSGLPIEGESLRSTTTWFDNGKKRESMARYYRIDPNFLPLLKISLAAGRNLSDSFSTDKTEGFLVNETFVAKMGWKKPIGQRIEGGEKKGKVIGVVRDFFYSSLHNAIEPLVMIYKEEPAPAVLAKVPAAEIPRLAALWKQFFPDRPFEYDFLDKNFMKLYDKDRMMMYLFNAFSALAIFISCLGLYGLVALITLQRTKELGIRKVLGASLLNLLTLQSTDQLLLIGLATLVALPLAGIGGQRWLSTYAWHTQLSLWIFVWPVIVILLLALGVTALRIIRAALANPVKNLRAE